MNSDIIITGVIGLITTIGGSWSSWVFARKKYNAEVDGTKIENLAKIIEVQNEQIKNLQERLNTSLERNKQLESELIDVRKQVSELMMKLIDKHIVLDIKNNSDE